MIHIETTRLRLRDWEETDLEPFSRLNADEQVMKYFPKTLSIEETKVFYKSFIGFIGFHKAAFEADFTPCTEIGWRLKKEVWGKGYATEGAAACLQYGFNSLGLHDVYSFTADVNAPSKRVMLKIGMRFIKTFHHPKVETDNPLSKHVLFHIERI